MGINGSAWKTYEWEACAWPEFREITIDRATQERYLRGLIRHFKTGPCFVENSQRRGGAGVYYRGGRPGQIIGHGRIKMSPNGNLGTLCHEFAHHLNWCRNKERGHRKKFKRELKRVYTWAKRWLPEIPKNEEAVFTTT